jgi:hypothetical protein
MKRIKCYSEFINEEISFGKLVTGIALSALGFFKPIQVSAQEFDSNDVKKIAVDTRSDKEFQTKLKKCVENSKKWWLERLKEQRTKNRLQNLHSLSDEEVGDYIKKYTDLINNFKVVVFDNDKLVSFAKELGSDHKSTAGMVVTAVPETVFISYNKCKSYDEKTLTNIISHELQHLLDTILETTPYGYIRGIFADMERPSYDRNSIVKRISDEFGISELEASEYEETWSELKDIYIEKLGRDFLENPKEINARVRDMRGYFGKEGIDDKITVEDIKNYVRELRDLDGADSSIDLIIIKWLDLGCPDLKKMLKDYNSFTKGEDDTTTRI